MSCWLCRRLVSRTVAGCAVLLGRLLCGLLWRRDVLLLQAQALKEQQIREDVTQIKQTFYCQVSTHGRHAR
jgi:hypothetical protein